MITSCRRTRESSFSLCTHQTLHMHDLFNSNSICKKDYEILPKLERRNWKPQTGQRALGAVLARILQFGFYLRGTQFGCSDTALWVVNLNKATGDSWNFFFQKHPLIPDLRCYPKWAFILCLSQCDFQNWTPVSIRSDMERCSAMVPIPNLFAMAPDTKLRYQQPTSEVENHYQNWERCLCRAWNKLD